MKSEAEMQSAVTAWLKKQEQAGNFIDAHYECKFSKGKPIHFVNSFQPQQLVFLKRAKHGCVRWKFSDAAPGLKMFDGGQMCFKPAFVIILFYKPRAPKIMHWIDIDDWLRLQETCNRKSATEEMIAAISTKYTLT